MVKRVATHRTTAPLIEAPVRWWSDEPRSIARMLDLCAASQPDRHSRLHQALLTLERSLPQLLEDGELPANPLETGELEADAVSSIAHVLIRCGHEARARQLLVEAVEMGGISQQAAEAVGIVGPQGEPREWELHSVVAEPENPEAVACRKRLQRFIGQISALAEHTNDMGLLTALASGVERTWLSRSGFQADDGQANPGRVMSHATKVHDGSMRGSAPRRETTRSRWSEALRRLDSTHPNLLRETEDELPLVFAQTSFVDGASLVVALQARIKLRGLKPALALFQRAVLANCIEWQRAPVAKALIGLLSSVPRSPEAAPAVRALRAAMGISVYRGDRQALFACLKALGAVEDATPRDQHLNGIKDAYCRVLDILGALQEPVLSQLHFRVTQAIVDHETVETARDAGLRLATRYQRQAKCLEGQAVSSDLLRRASLEYFLGRYVLHASRADDEQLPRFRADMAAFQEQAWRGFATLF
jgi:hypothetical protein